jgi:hypothetical protein
MDGPADDLELTLRGLAYTALGHLIRRERQPRTVVVVLDDQAELTVVYAPKGGPAEPAPDPPEKSRPSPCAADIVRTLAESPVHLTTTQLLSILDQANRPHGESTVKAHLARLHKAGVIANDRDGYYLPATN